MKRAIIWLAAIAASLVASYFLFVPY